MRPLIDLSRRNQFVLCPHFKVETLDSIRLALQMGDLVTLLDLRDAYFHISIHLRAYRYLRFVLEGKVYQFRTLPFGLSESKYVFTWTLKANGSKAFRFMLTWTTFCLRGSIMASQQKALVNSSGPNWEKSELVPAQDFSFLGA